MPRRGLTFGFLSHWRFDSYWRCCRDCGCIFVGTRFAKRCEVCVRGRV